MNHRLFYMAAMIIRNLGSMITQWPMLLALLFFISPMGTHIRWEYQHRGSYDRPVYISCTYLGSRGFIRVPPHSDCPFIAWLDARRYTLK